MILDFRDRYSAITSQEVSQWCSVGVDTVLFTIHHPGQFSDENLKKLQKKVELIRSFGLRPGIYTGLLGIEKEGTISRYNLSSFLQKNRDGLPVYYHSSKTKPWGKMFCPNSCYVREYRMPLLRKAANALKLSTIYFDLPWFRTGGCFCESCMRELTVHLKNTGLNNFTDKVPTAELTNQFSPLYSEFLRFKLKSIHDCIRETSAELKDQHPDLKILCNMGSTLSMIDNQHEGAWLCNLDKLGSDVLIEFNPYSAAAKSPLFAVGAAIKLARTSLRGKGKVVFASTISDRPGDSKSKFYDPQTLEALYTTIKKAGGIPYISYTASDLTSLKSSAPTEEYFDMFKRISKIQPDLRVQKVAVVYSRMSYHFSMKKGLKRMHNNYHTHQTQYLWPLRDAIAALEDRQTPYTLVELEETDLEQFDTVLAPRTVLIRDEDIVKIIAYAEKGGHVITSQEAGKLNNRGTERKSNPLSNHPKIKYIENTPDWAIILDKLEVT